MFQKLAILCSAAGLVMTVACAQMDPGITTAVKTKFLAEPGVSGLNINVDTNNGVVTLKGTVKSKAEADKAIAIARRSAGVKSVVNNLRIG